VSSRGIRNHNPGNIDRGQPWQGLATAAEMTPEQKAETRFAVFSSPEWGIRAMVRIIQTYRTKYGLETVAGIIKRWAPPVENQTTVYINAVAASMNVQPDSVLDTSDPEILSPLLKAIILHENGEQPYSDATIVAGIALAGLKGGDSGPLSKDRENVVKSSTVQASGGVLTAIGGLLVTAITGTSGSVQIIIVGFCGVATLGALWIMRERLRKWAAGDR